MKYESPVLELISAPQNAIMDSLEDLNIVGPWDMQVEDI